MMQSLSKIKLPRLVSDGMVMQRNTQANVWGWAPSGEAITVMFLENTYQAVADADGKWHVSFCSGNAGGPYDMVIEAANVSERVTVKNILLGDVWLCSGQSNMAMTMFSLRDKYADEVANASNNHIRQFLVPAKYDFENECKDLESGSWEAATPQSVMSFTAAGYFFALKLFEEYHIPIGLINASIGGAPAEAWMSADALRPFPDYLESANKLKDRNYVETLLKKDQTDSEEWHQNIDKNDQGIPRGGKPCYDQDYDASTWSHINIPSFWEEEGLGRFNGTVWFRKEIEIPSLLSDLPATLFLGNIVDEDMVYINGSIVGTGLMQYIPRKYEIPEGLLKEGKNTIVVRVINSSGKGGFYKGKPYHLKIGDDIIGLSGVWQYMIGVKSEPIPEPSFVMWRPTGLYNGMISPLYHYAIKGVIWYQGETNAQYPGNYESLFKAMIADWRKKWGQGDFPFLYVQLPNYKESHIRAAGNWAPIREAQRRMLSMPNTGMAITIDIGEWNDVHPQNKKDIGFRLALTAKRAAYGDDEVVASGPLLLSAKRDGLRVILSFSDGGGGLEARGEKLEYFEVAGTNGIFIRANARIEGNCVAVWHDEVSDPAHVRYAWDDNPEGANLYNSENLPASPFICHL